VRVRPAEGADFEAVTALLEELGRPKVTDATSEKCRTIYERQLEDDRTAHLVAVNGGGAVVGFCSLHFRDRLNFATPDAWVPDLIVTGSARRQGAARAMLEEAERRARERRCWMLTLESAHFRREAHLLYAAFGMEDTAKSFDKLLS
jgi:GNAT superfamily N-acetyltransferase